MPSSTWRSASQLFSSYGQTDLANEASFRADMAEQHEKTDAAIAESKYHYADHARRARIADANAATIPESVDEAFLVEREELPDAVQRYADNLVSEGEVGELYTKDFQLNDKISFQAIATLVEDNTTENTDRCVAVLLDMGQPVATANLLYQQVGKSWQPKEENESKKSEQTKRSQVGSPKGSIDPGELERVKVLDSQGNKDAQTVMSLIHAAEEGNAQGQFYLAHALHEGSFGVTTDRTRSIMWYQKAVDQGHIKACMELGRIYQLGEGVEPDEPTALSIFEIAAKAGDPLAQRVVQEIKIHTSQHQQTTRD